MKDDTVRGMIEEVARLAVAASRADPEEMLIEVRLGGEFRDAHGAALSMFAAADLHRAVAECLAGVQRQIPNVAKVTVHWPPTHSDFLLDR